MILDGKSLQEYSVNTGVPQRIILGSLVFRLYSNDFPDGVICNIAKYTDNNTLHFECDQGSDLKQQLQQASEHESDLQDTVDWARERPVDFNAFTCFRLNDLITGAIDVRTDGYAIK